MSEKTNATTLADRTKPTYTFETWQAILIAGIIAIVIELLLIKFSTLRGSSIVVLIMAIFLLIMSFLDSPARWLWVQFTYSLFFIFLAVIFGTEAYFITSWANRR